MLDKDGVPGGYASDRSVSNCSDHLISIATQTGEATVLDVEHEGLIAPGIPISGIYHGAWPIQKGTKPSSLVLLYSFTNPILYIQYISCEIHIKIPHLNILCQKTCSLFMNI